MATVNMIAAAGSAFASQIQASRSTPPATGATYVPDATGYVANVDVRDIDLMEKAGFVIAGKAHRVYSPLAYPAAASQAVTFASAALSNGTMTVAAQPDVPRQLQAIINPGTTAITAGTLALNYLANDGTTQVDNLSLIMAAGAAATTIKATLATTKGVEHMTSMIVTGLVGGTSPAIQVGTNTAIALPVDVGFSPATFVITKESKVTMTVSGTLTAQIPADEAVGTVTTTGALVVPTTVPAAGIGYVFHYTYAYPG